MYAIVPKRFKGKLLISIKLTVLGVYLFLAVSGHYPPVMAQIHKTQIQTIPVLTVEDAVQDTNIEAANKISVIACFILFTSTCHKERISTK